MIEINEFTRPATVSEAYALLKSNGGAAVVGGGTFIRLASRKISLAIDLSRANLDFIRETGNTLEIGAMATLRALETHEVLNKNFDGLFAKATGQIVGVQFRNLATAGGTVYGRYAFSDLITALMVLPSSVVLHQAGELPLADFLTAPRTGLDILEKVIIQKTPVKAAYHSFRNTAGSLPILNVAAARSDHGIRIAIGARPGQPVLAYAAMAELNLQLKDDELQPDDMAEIAGRAATIAAEEISFADDRRASGVYRHDLAQALVERAVLEVIR